MEEGVSPTFATGPVKNQPNSVWKGAIEAIFSGQSRSPPEQLARDRGSNKSLLGRSLGDGIQCSPLRKNLVSRSQKQSPRVMMTEPVSAFEEFCELRRQQYKKNSVVKIPLCNSTQTTNHLIGTCSQGEAVDQLLSEARTQFASDLNHNPEINPLPGLRPMLQKFKQRLFVAKHNFSSTKLTNASERNGFDLSFGHGLEPTRVSRSKNLTIAVHSTKLSPQEPPSEVNQHGIKLSPKISLNPDTERPSTNLSTGCSTTVQEENKGPKYFLPQSLQKLHKQPKKTISGQRMHMFRKPKEKSIDKCPGDLDEVFPEPETPNPSLKLSNYFACRLKNSQEHRFGRQLIDLHSRRSSLKSGTSNDTDGLFLVKNYNRYDSQRKILSAQKSHNEITISKMHPRSKEFRAMIGDSARVLKDQSGQVSMLMPPSQRSMIGQWPSNDQSVVQKTNLSNDGDFGRVPHFNFDQPGSRIVQVSPKLSGISAADDSKHRAHTPADNSTPPLTAGSGLRPLDTNLDLAALIGNCSVLNRKRIELAGS